VPDWRLQEGLPRARGRYDAARPFLRQTDRCLLPKHVQLELDVPKRVTAGEDLTAVLKVTARAPVELVGATVRWVRRDSRHERLWQFRIYAGSVGWSQPFRRHREEVQVEETLDALIGRQPAGTLPEARVRLETGEVSPTALMPRDFGEVSNFVEAELRCGDGSVVQVRHRVFVRPQVSGRLERRASTNAGSPQEASLAFSSSPPASSLQGEFYRPVEGVAVLRAGARDLPEGWLEVGMVCTARWDLHSLARIAPRGLRQAILARLRRPNWQEVSREQKSSETSIKLGAVRTPAVSAGTKAEVSFSWPGPTTGMAQSTTTPEGSISWELEGGWQAGGSEVSATAPITMAMPPPRTEPGGRRRRRERDA
jgi:hypothetical protein